MLRSATVEVAWSTTQMAGLPSEVIRAEDGITTICSPASCMRPETTEPSSIPDGGLSSPTRTVNVPVIGLAWGETSRTTPVALMRGSSVRLISTGVCRDATRSTCGGTSNTASVPPSRAIRRIIWPPCTTSPASAPRAVTEPSNSAVSTVKPTRSSAICTCASALLTCDSAARKAARAVSRLARVVNPSPISDCCRWRASPARTRSARAALSAACAASNWLRSFICSRRARTWPLRTRSPTFTGRSIRRPEMRNAIAVSSSAAMRPDSTTTSPASRFSIVRERTGRASGSATASSARWQAERVAHAAKATASDAMLLLGGRVMVTCMDSALFFSRHPSGIIGPGVCLKSVELIHQAPPDTNSPDLLLGCAAERPRSRSRTL